MSSENVDCTVSGEREGVEAERGRERESVCVHVPHIIIWRQPNMFWHKNILILCWTDNGLCQKSAAHVIFDSAGSALLYVLLLSFKKKDSPAS